MPIDCSAAAVRFGHGKVLGVYDLTVSPRHRSGFRT